MAGTHRQYQSSVYHRFVPRNVAGWIEHHVPSELRDLTGSKASFGGKQDDQAIAEGMAGAAGKQEEVVDVTKREYFCLLASHIE